MLMQKSVKSNQIAAHEDESFFHFMQKDSFSTV